MAFPGYEPGVPTTLAGFRLTVAKRVDEENNLVQTATYQLHVLDENGQRMGFPGDAGNVIPHLESGELQALQALIDSLIGRAKTALNIVNPGP